MPLPGPVSLPWYWRLALKPPVLWLLSRTVGPPVAMVYLAEAARRVFKPEEPVPGYLETARAPLVMRPGTLLANVQDLVGLPQGLAALSPRYGGLHLPVTIVSGAADPIVRPDLQAVPLSRAIHAARGGAHAPLHRTGGGGWRGVRCRGRREGRGGAGLGALILRGRPVGQALSACSRVMKVRRTRFVAPGVPKGRPATTMIRSPTAANFSRTANFAARKAMSSTSLASFVTIG